MFEPKVYVNSIIIQCIVQADRMELFVLYSLECVKRSYNQQEKSWAGVGKSVCRTANMDSVVSELDSGWGVLDSNFHAALRTFREAAFYRIRPLWIHLGQSYQLGWLSKVSEGYNLPHPCPPENL